MKTQFEKNAGIALVLCTVLIVLMMVLHPAGGGFEHLLKMTGILIVSHVIAILSVPFASVGFWGLTRRLGVDNFFSISAFAIMLFGLVAVMIAAATNGLVLPVFIEKYRDAPVEVIESIKPFLRYNTAVNRAFDYVYTGAFCLSMLFWSIAILRTKKMAAWLAYLGIGLAIVAAVLFISGIASANLQGFRLFISSIVLWIALVGVVLMRSAE